MPDPVTRKVIENAVHRLGIAAQSLGAAGQTGRYESLTEWSEYLTKIAADLQAALDRPAEWTDDGPWPELADPPERT